MSMLYHYFLRCILFAIILASWRRLRRKIKATNTNDYCHSGVFAIQDETHHSSTKWPQDDSDVVSRIDGRGGQPILSLAVSGDNRSLRMVTLRKGENKLHVWSIADDQLVEETDSPSIKHSGGVTINAIAASKDGRYIVTGDDHGKVMVWNTATHASTKVCELVAAEGRITALDVSSDSLRFATGSEDGAVAVWSIEDGEHLIGPLKDQDSPVSSVKFSPTGGRIASAYRVVGRDNRSVRIWHSRTGVQLESIPIAQPTYSLAWSADNQRLFVGGSRGSIKCFNVVTRSFLPGFRAPSGDLITTLCLTGNGQLLVSVSSGRVASIDFWDIWGTPPSEPLRSCTGVFTAGISPDDACLVTVGKGNDITMRSLAIIVDKAHLFHRIHPWTKHLEPLTYISTVAYEAWKSGRVIEAEETLSKEIEDPRYRDFIRYKRANRALVRIRQKDWTGAHEDIDAIMSNVSQAPLIASLAKALALHGQGDVDRAMDAFGSILGGCDGKATRFVECVKHIVFLNVEGADATRSATDVPSNSSDVDLHILAEARKQLELANGCMIEHDYEGVLTLLGTVPDLRPLLHAPDVETIPLIFGWGVYSLISDIHKLRCRALFESRHIPGVLDYFSEKGADLIEESGIITGELSSLSEEFGDDARGRQRYDEAIAWYTESLALAGCPLDIINREVATPQEEDDKVPATRNPRTDIATAQCWDRLSRLPRCVAHLLAKRGEAEVAKRSWKLALADANQAIEMDPSYPLGYHGKYTALLGMQDYKEAFGPLREMFSKFENFSDPEINNLRENYLKTLAEIDQIIKEVFDASPFVLIHVGDGRLCDQKERRRRFEDDEAFYKLVTLMSIAPNMADIERAVKGYFLYVMFSHTWGENEPSFEDVSGKSVYDIPNEKLRRFCETVRDDPKHYRWSWSDTCCINKQDSDVYAKSIRSMYKWYNNSALTLVVLAHPSMSTPPNSPNLEHNRWMFRAWTLQELLAPKVIRFYDHKWKLYLDDESDNHKTSPKIKAELARATGIQEDALIDFYPEVLPVRQRLCLASTRKATVEVDIAYSLIGIFHSDIRVEYTCEAYVALGRLLQECVNRRGEVTVLDWVGESSKFNSSIPADVSVYSQPPYTLPDITDDELDKRTEALRHTSLEQELPGFYHSLVTLNSPRFSDRRLSVPCIICSIDSVNADVSDVCNTLAYVASTTAFGKFEFKTKEPCVELCRGPLVLAYPWIPDLLAKIRRRKGDNVSPLWLIPYLEHGFKALLFTEQSHRQYRRVAADTEIVVPARQLSSLKGIRVETLEVWERL